MNSEEKNRPNLESLHGMWDDAAVCRLKTAYHRTNIIKNIEGCFRKGPSVRMLEFGPGVGCLVDLVQMSWPQTEYHIADMDAGLLSTLAARCPFIHAHQIAGIRDLENIQGLFDVIAAVDVWEHLPLSDALAYTAWCWQRLAPGGILIIQTPNWACPVTPATFYGDLTHCTPLNEASIRQLFRGAGIPEASVVVRPRKTPGVLGMIRDSLNTVFGLLYRLVFVFFGAVRPSIFTPDLVAVVCKPSRA